MNQYKGLLTNLIDPVATGFIKSYTNLQNVKRIKLTFSSINLKKWNDNKQIEFWIYPVITNGDAAIMDYTYALYNELNMPWLIKRAQAISLLWNKARNEDGSAYTFKNITDGSDLQTHLDEMLNLPNDIMEPITIKLFEIIQEQLVVITKRVADYSKQEKLLKASKQIHKPSNIMKTKLSNIKNQAKINGIKASEQINDPAMDEFFTENKYAKDQEQENIKTKNIKVK